ncbi:YecA family protein [Vibrio cidicii]|uniref:YecA/YgfB family protein n=1 Tax=Vibrio cidicii TaxID=1763883 RepID=UPI003F50E12B
MTLFDILSLEELDGKLLNLAKTQGFVTSMAAAPNILDPHEWLPFLWGGEETAPFSDGEQLEAYIDAVVQLWNQARPALLDGSWQWPENCKLDDAEIVNQATRDFCEGVLQGWQLARDDWETLMPEESEENALLGGVLLSLTMLYDPETTIATLREQGFEGLEQFAEIFNAMPVMLCGLTQRGVMLAEQQ